MAEEKKSHLPGFLKKLLHKDKKEAGEYYSLPLSFVLRRSLVCSIAQVAPAILSTLKPPSPAGRLLRTECLSASPSPPFSSFLHPSSKPQDPNSLFINS